MAIIVMLALLYKFYAVPLGAVVAFFMTRRLLRHHAFGAAAGTTLASTIVIFTPLTIPSQTFFSDFYAPWYVALMLTPPTPQISVGALLITLAVSLMSSALALIGVKK